MTQEQALEILKSGENVFLTGEAGTGKSYTVSRFVEWMRKERINYAITATTGIAASHINGYTIHSWSGMGIKRDLTADQVRYIKNNQWIAEKIRETQVLIIDEISMMDAVALNDLNKVLCSIKSSQYPFGGMQMVFVGDFFQLPPVVKEGERHFAFEADAWEEAQPVVCYLTKQYRQSDMRLTDILTSIRRGGLSQEQVATLQECQMHTEPDTKLYTHNLDADAINTAELSKLGGLVKTYEMKSGGNPKLVEILKRQCISPETLTLKIGAVVMFTRNNFERGYVNGTVGKIVEFNAQGVPVVETKDGERLVPESAEWELEDRFGSTAWIRQTPLKLAWAITVHKSQGMSLDQASIDLSKVFEFGQGYVAVSRVTTLDGLHLKGVSADVFKMHPTVMEQDKVFREQSGLRVSLFS